MHFHKSKKSAPTHPINPLLLKKSTVMFTGDVIRYDLPNKSDIRFYQISIMLSKLILILLILALILATVQYSQSDGDSEEYSHDQKNIEEEDQDQDASETDSDEKYATFTKFINSEKLDEEVNVLIGIHAEEKDERGQAKNPADLSNLKRVLQNNRKWAKDKVRQDAQFFGKHVSSQKPKYLWIGCSDSRLPANQILGLDYGEVFVLRNVANMVSPSDISSLAVIQYAVEVLQVEDIIVAGHYNCGGVKAAVTKYDHGPLEAWLSKLRRIRHKHAHAFVNLTTVEEKAKLLVEINVKEQVFNVASTPFVQQAWKSGRQLSIHGLVFSLENGRLIDLNITLHTLEQIPEELAVVE